jgi:hypothetical protein
LPVLVAARLLLGAWLLAAPGVGPSWKWCAAGYLVVSLLACRWLRVTQGADSQLTLITSAAISLTLLSDTAAAAGYCLYFLTLQLCLAYFAAGFHKLRSRPWRDGSALPGILAARLFGSPALAPWLARRRWLARPATVGVVAWELAFPVILVAPPEVCWCCLACGVVFHLGTAVTMGLNKFVWAFLALYPAAVYCATGSILVLPG